MTQYSGVRTNRSPAIPEASAIVPRVKKKVVTMNIIENGSWRFTGKHMLALVTGFFVIIFVMNLVLAYFALASWPGLLVRNGFDASQTYNQEIEQVRIQNQLGWQSSVELKQNRVVFRITDNTDNPLSGLKIVAAAARPTNEAEDRVLELKEMSGGIYQGKTALLSGNWVISVHATDESTARVYRRQFRIFVQP